MKRVGWKWVSDIALVVIGNLLYAAAVFFLLEPTRIITGGATGIALFLNHEFGLSVSGTLLLINVLMGVIGWIFLGRKFAMGTALSSLILPAAVALFEQLGNGYALTHDIFLCAAFGGLTIGVSLGLVMRAGFSTGGMDIPPLLLHKYCRISVASAMWGVDVFILLLQSVRATPDAIMYGILMVVVYSLTIDRVMVIGTSRVQVQVVSRSVDEIRAEIQRTVDRGVTLLHGKTGYLGEETEVLLTVITKRELRAVERSVHRIDPHAFLTVTRVSAVRGRGFSLGKEYLDGEEKALNRRDNCIS